MAHFNADLEIGPDGVCMAHVCALPGCSVRAATREEALARLPDAIREYYGWLRRHGESMPDPDPMTVEAGEVSEGYGPFTPGDAAALFEDDQRPVSLEEMETIYFPRAHYARADLLMLTRRLAPRILDWKPREGEMSVRRILTHAGNAEQWYISRLVEPETLPEEWNTDEGMRLFQRLDMARRTGLDRLRQMTEEERCRVTTQAMWTRHPDEPWTVRKALRRMCEHEQEHTGHIRQVLGEWRRHLLARVAAERAHLLTLLLRLDEKTLCEAPVFENTTAKDLLAHLAAWDAWHAETIRMVLAGRSAELMRVVTDERNAALLAERKDWTLEQAVSALTAARADFLKTVEPVSEEAFHQKPARDLISIRARVERRRRHDKIHARDLERWRKAGEFPKAVGPKAVLLAALDAARAELVAAMELVRPEEHESTAVCGEWTLVDLLDHTADWERLAAEVLHRATAGETVQTEYTGDIQAWNDAHALDRKDHPKTYAQAWDEFQSARKRLLDALTGISQAELGRVFTLVGEGEITPYDWASIWVYHDREHAEDLRRVMGDKKVLKPRQG